MSSNKDDKLKNFESNSDLSQQNINFFAIENKNTLSKKNGLNKLNLNKPPNKKDKDKYSILSDSSYENEKNNQNENSFNEKNKNHQFSGDIIDINESSDNYNNQENINNYNNNIINNLKAIKNKFFNQNSNLDKYIINNNINNINNNNNENNVSRSMSSQQSKKSSQSPQYQRRSRSRSRSSNYSPTNNINIQLNNNNNDININNYLRNNNKNNQNLNLGNKFQNLSNSKKGNNSNKKFVMKNGCCRDCMKAFSKNGKSCLCQVPKKERKFHLSENGCNYCGCKGCNPLDIKINERRIERSKLYQDKSIFYKNQRILDSEDEDLKIKEQDVDNYNIEKRGIKEDLNDILKINSIFYGYGVPLRTSSYILGYNPAYNNYSYNKKNENNKNNNLDLYNNSNNNNKNNLNNKFRKNNYNYGNNASTNNNINISGINNLNSQMFKNK